MHAGVLDVMLRHTSTMQCKRNFRIRREAETLISLALLQYSLNRVWSGPEPAVSPRYACILIGIKENVGKETGRQEKVFHAGKLFLIFLNDAISLSPRECRLHAQTQVRE